MGALARALHYAPAAARLAIVYDGFRYHRERNRAMGGFVAVIVAAFLIACASAVAQPSNSAGTGSAGTGSVTPGTPVERRVVLNVADFDMRPSNTAARNGTAWASVHARYEAMGGSTTIFIPPGNYNLDVSSGPFVLDQLWWKIDASAVVLQPVGGGSVIRCQPTTHKQGIAGGPGEILGLAVYTTSNVASGTLVDIDNCNNVTMHDVRLSGGYRNLRIASSQQFYGSNINLNGDNTTPGSTMILVERGNFFGYSNGNNAAFTLDNFSAFSSASYTNGMVINNADGGYFTNGRVGNTKHDAILIQPGTTTDPLDGLQFVNVSADTAGGNTRNVAHGYHFAGLTGYNGTTGSHIIIGAGIDLSTGSGIFVDDEHLASLTILGTSNVLNGRVSGDDITILAGSAISIMGGAATQANVAGSSNARHVRIGGTASGVIVSGMAFAAGDGHAVPYDIGVEGDASNVVISQNLHTGATVGPLSIADRLSNITVADITSPGTLEVSGKLIMGGALELTPRTPPSSSTKCATGQLSIDADFIYVCTARDVWKRTALSRF